MADDPTKVNDQGDDKQPDKLYIKAELEETEKGLQAIASTSVEDRHGEVVAVDGWDLKNFKKNPVLQWAHNPYEMAIGTAKSVRLEGEGKRRKLVFEPVFHEATELARAAKKLVEDGILKAFSVGFRPLEIDGNKYLSQELLEISLVNVPANPDALMLSYKTLQSAGISPKTIEQAGISQDRVKLIQLERDMEVMQTRFDNAVKGRLQSPASPKGRSADPAKRRQRILKVADKVAERLHADAKAGKASSPSLTKALDKAMTALLTENKEEIHGTH